MKSDLPNETIKPAYPLGDANIEPKPEQGKKATDGQATPQADPKPKKVDEPQTDGQ